MIFNLVPIMNTTVTELPSAKIAKIAAYSALSIVSLVGNAFILLAIHRDNRLKTTTNKLIANMAVSDLLIPLFGIQEEIINIYDGWELTGKAGPALCKLVHFFQDASLIVSVYSCVFIAIDRFYAVKYPLKVGFSKTRLRFIIGGIWTLAVAMAVPSLLKYQLVSVPDREYCHEDWTYIGADHMFATRVQIFTFFTLLNGIPIPTVIVLYALIALNMKRMKTPGESSPAASARRERRNKRVIKLSVVVIFLLFSSWLFLDVVIFLGLLGHLDSLPPMTIRDLIFSAKFIAFSSSAYNFFVYLGLCDQYRSNFKVLFSMCCFCLRKHQNVAICHSGDTNNEVVNMDAAETL